IYIPCVKSFLRVIANCSVIKLNLPTRRIAILRRGSEAIAVSAMVLVGAVAVGYGMDYWIFLGTPVPTDIVVLHQQTSFSCSAVASVGVPSRRGIAEYVEVVKNHAVTSCS